ncbi:hypothetical protein BC834DRAFT_890484 [Gloeopeniophorella convolvens]|nr:hypothetical protein BC834DRAFT_890484 [Gloeopeniophorella convolvens]
MDTQYIRPFKSFSNTTFATTPNMPDPGYAELHTLAVLESPSVPDSKRPNSLCFDALLHGQGAENSTLLTRLHFYNGNDYTFDPEGTAGILTARIAAYDKSIERPSATFMEGEYHNMGDANSFTPLSDISFNPAQHHARFTMSGTVDTINQDPEAPSFTLNIPQYFSVTGKDSRPVLPLKCVLQKSKKWKDPAALLPFPRSVVSCAGVFSHYEMESRNGRTVPRLVVILDVIEFLAKPSSERTGASTPTKSDGSLLARSRYARKSGAMCSPSPKALGKHPLETDDNGHAEGHTDEPPLKRCVLDTGASS